MIYLLDTDTLSRLHAGDPNCVRDRIGSKLIRSRPQSLRGLKSFKGVSILS
jgi:hypothetical protein